METPPTESLIKMRKKHTRQGVDYNMNHLKDHLKDANKSVKKMATVDPKGAAQSSQEIKNTLSNLLNQVKGDSMNKPLKKTGKTDGEPNKLGGGGRFKQLVNQGKSPALAAWIGRKKYGSKAMAHWAAVGKKGK